MNRLIRRPWFGPGLGAMLYLAGFNDALLHEIGKLWLELGRIPQTLIVLALLGLIAYFVNDYLKERRSAYSTAVRAAAVNDRIVSNFESSGLRANGPRREGTGAK